MSAPKKNLPSVETEVKTRLGRMQTRMRAIPRLLRRAGLWAERFWRERKERFSHYISGKKRSHAVHSVNVRRARLFYRISYNVRNAVRTAGYYAVASVRLVMPFLVPVLGAAILVVSGIFVSRHTVALRVFLNEKDLGVCVRDEATFDRVRDRLSTAFYQNNNGEYYMDAYPTLRMAVVERTQVRTADEIFEAVYANVAEDFGKSYGVYLDGKLLGTLKRESEVLALQRQLLSAYVEDPDNTDWRILNGFSYEKGTFDKNDARTPEEMLLLFTRPVHSLKHTVKSGETASSVAQMYGLNVPELKLLNPGLKDDAFPVGTVLEVGAPSCKLSVVETRTVRYRQIVPYQTVSTETDAYLEGQSVVTTAGVNGLYDVELSVVIVNGIEMSRTEQSRTKVRDAITQRVSIGTRSIAPSGEFLWPLASYYSITSYYGWRTLRGVPGFHRGLDIAATTGTRIFAADDGVVYETGYQENGLGNFVKVNHGNGIVSVYGHCSRIAKGIKKGVRVKKGDVVAYVGSTGNSTGSHLHFALCYTGTTQYINPLPYLKKD